MPVGGECVQEGVSGGVVSLPSGSHHAGHRRVQDELRVAGELVEVPRGVDLRAHHGGEAFRSQRADHTVVQHTSRVHDGGQPHVCQQVRDSGAFRDVAGPNVDFRAQRDEFVAQVGRPRCVGAASADEQQSALAACRQVACDDSAETARAAGDQNRAVRIPFTRNAFACPCQPARENLTGAYDDLGLPSVDQPADAGQKRFRLGCVVEVDEQEPTGVLGLRGPHQAPDRGGREVITGDRAARDKYEPLSRFLKRAKHLRCQRMRGFRRLLAGHWHQRRVGRRVEGGHPVEAEQRVDASLRGQLAERLDAHGFRGQHRVSGDVDRVQHEPIVHSRQPDAHDLGAGRVQRYAAPIRGNAVQSKERGGVRGGVQQCRVDPESFGVTGQRGLGEDLMATPPRCPQPLKRFSIRCFVVEAVEIHDGRALRRPFGIVGGRQNSLSEHTVRVLDPFVVAASRVEPERTVAPDLELDLYDAAVRQHQWRDLRELFNALVTGDIGGSERQLQHAGGREHDVIGEPRRLGQRAGEDRVRRNRRRSSRRRAAGGRPGPGRGRSVVRPR